MALIIKFLRYFSLIIILFIMIAAFIIVLNVNSNNNSKLKTGKIKIGNNLFNVEIATSTIAKIKGLSGKEKLDDNIDGMAFVFQKPSKPLFWMKGMKFAIDIIWIKDNTIKEITKNVQPPSKIKYIKKIRPKYYIDTVLEIPASQSNYKNISVGDKIEKIYWPL